MLLHLRPLQNHAPLQAHAITDNDVRPNNNIRSDLAVLADLGGGVDHDIAAVDPGCGRGCEQFAALFREGGEVEAGAAEEVLGLPDVHPEALEVEGVELPIFDDRGEGLLLDGSRAEFDAGEDGGVEDVDAGVDAVADELDGFLDEAVDAGGVVGFVHYDAVFARFLDLRHNNGSLLAVLVVELGELAERELADDVGVEDEKGFVVFPQNLLCEFKRAGGAQWLGLDGEGDFDVELLFVFLEGCGHYLGPVVDCEDDVGHPCFGEGFDLVGDHGSVAELDEGFGEGEGEGAETSAEAADEDESCDGVSIGKGGPS